MASEIRLHHIGEAVLAGLLQEEAARGRLDIPCALHHDGCGLSTVLDREGVGSSLRFEPNVTIGPTQVGARKYQFDGAHGVDVLVRGSHRRGVAIEAKFGIERMSVGAFKNRFLEKPKASNHGTARINGGMISLLNYRALDEVSISIRTAGPDWVELARSWFLVIRRRVWDGWRRSGRIPLLMSAAHILVLEDIVERHGDARAFDDLVRRIIGEGFFESWGLGL